MSILDFLLSIVAPYDCLGCGTEGDLLCPRCLGELPLPPRCCYRCQRKSANTQPCAACVPRSPLSGVAAAAAYEAASKALVWQLKYNGARSAATLMAHRMSRLLVIADATVLVPVPTATGRIRQRGYDQAVLLARSLSRLTGLPVAAHLARTSQAHQVGAGRRQRLSQLDEAFRVSMPRRLTGAHVLLVDDVLTTGSTLESAAKVLLAAGAGSVSAVVFAQAV